QRIALFNAAAEKMFRCSASDAVGQSIVVLVNPTQLAQIFQNLIGNAIKFRGPKAPQIQITVEKQPDEWLFSVTDNGIGIAPEYCQGIFVIFKRLHTRTEYPGNGIGLAICRKII